MTPSTSFLGPDNIFRFIKNVGIPYALAFFLLLVLLGIIPTALMNGLDLIPRIWGAQENQADILEDIREISITSCEFQAPDKEAVKKCRPRSQ